MGTSGWRSDEYAGYTSSIATKSVNQVYTATKVKKELDPNEIRFRESCDSDAHPNSTPIIIAQDVTGSMSDVLDSCIRRLDVLVEELLERKPVPDPHIMFMGIGDIEMDNGPLQVTQFETDIKIAKQLSNIWLEQGGGRNSYESYTLAWLFAALKTKCDNWDKRGEKGLLFTIGDEMITPYLYADDLKSVGLKIEGDKISAYDIYQMVSEKWDVYHFNLTKGYGRANKSLEDSWKEVIGQHFINLDDHSKLPEAIVSQIMAAKGMSKHEILQSWADGGIRDALRESLNLHDD